jgi:hypothetical protein
MSTLESLVYRLTPPPVEFGNVGENLKIHLAQSKKRERRH